MREQDARASNRHRLDASAGPTAGAEASADSSRVGRGALVALGVAAIGTVAFAIGLRSAVRRLPPERPAGAPSAVDSTLRGRFAPPAPNQPDEYPRLR